MIRIVIAFVLFLYGAQAIAQQPSQTPDPAFMQKAINALQVQRNQALDAMVVQQAKTEGLVEELSVAKNKIKELEAQIVKDKPDAQQKSGAGPNDGSGSPQPSVR